MKMVRVACSRCGTEVDRPAKEVKRSEKLGRRPFCSSSCSGQDGNELNRREVRDLEMTCPCGRNFMTTDALRAARHCSRGCASKYSMNEVRREAQRQAGLDKKGNLSPALALKSREAWKYELLQKSLVAAGVDHEFEFEFGGFIYDLALKDGRILVEFDGPDHKYLVEQDREKSVTAEAAGFVVVHRSVHRGVPVPVEAISDLVPTGSQRNER